MNHIGVIKKRAIRLAKHQLTVNATQMLADLNWQSSGNSMLSHSSHKITVKGIYRNQRGAPELFVTGKVYRRDKRHSKPKHNLEIIKAMYSLISALESAHKSKLILPHLECEAIPIEAKDDNRIGLHHGNHLRHQKNL